DDRYLTAISDAVSLPVLRKDFIVDVYQLYLAQVIGAAAIRLIVRLLSDDELRRFHQLADRLGLSALVETHSSDEISRAIAAGSRLIGVNNRDLGSFTVDLNHTAQAATQVPDDVVFVSDSGLDQAAAIAQVERLGADAVLVGEALMRQTDKVAGLRALRQQLPHVKICGLSRPDDVAGIVAAAPDAVGFVFAPASRRRVSAEQAAALGQSLPPFIRRVGVFVDAAPAEIIALVRDGIIDSVQLHGHEDDAAIRQLRDQIAVPIIKAIRMDQAPDSWLGLAAADELLVDSGAGSGQTFDWQRLPQFDRPIWLAGGLNRDNVTAALQVPGVGGVDISSGVEVERAGQWHKDANLVADVVAQVRNFANPRRSKETA
ncbi:MAG: hypothetical protein LBL92_06620, partial [Propionibacteriaceae bacterium]|nr:hypothetical protein [Propionibacteriaceae bacterium]